MKLSDEAVVKALIEKGMQPEDAEKVVTRARQLDDELKPEPEPRAKSEHILGQGPGGAYFLLKLDTSKIEVPQVPATIERIARDARAGTYGKRLKPTCLDDVLEAKGRAAKALKEAGIQVRPKEGLSLLLLSSPFAEREQAG